MKKTIEKTRLLFPKKWHTVLLVLILSFAFFTRIIRLHVPERYIFDEVYHTVTARLISQNDPRAFEWWNPPPEKDTAVDWLHPPIAKYTQAFFISALKDSSFSWRLSSVLFGVGVIWLTYKLASDIFKNQEIGLVAATIASLDGLLLTQSRITMNDIHVTFFILLTLWLYWKHRQQGKTIEWTPNTWKRLLTVGFSAGLAMASKWSGLFTIAIIGLFEASDLLHYFFKTLTAKSAQQKNIVHSIGHIAKTKATLFLCLGILPIVVYVSSYMPMFMQGKTLFCFEQKAIQGECYFERITFNGNTVWEGYLSHFAMLHRQIWWYQTHLDASHTYQSRPWQWFLDLKPVWYHVDYGSNPNQVANIYAFGNPAVFWFGAIAVIFTLSILTAQKSKYIKKILPVIDTKIAFGLLFILVSYGMVWLPWVASPRIMFFYHYTPAVPLMSVILGFWLHKLLTNTNQNIKSIGYFAMLAMTICFVVWFPQWTAIPVPKEFANTVYYAIKSWK